MVGSINSLCLILELFSRSNFKLKRERSELRDRVNLKFEPKRIQKMAKRRPIEQREQKPNLFGLCRVASEEDESQPNEQRVNVPVPVILQNLYPKHNSRVNIELAADFPARL